MQSNRVHRPRPLELGEWVEIHRALADPGRVRLVLALRGRELCLCQLAEWLGLSASTVSRHLAQLRRAGLVEARREGRWTWFRRVDADPATAVARTLDDLDASLGDDPSIRTDLQSLERIASRPPVCD